MLRFWQNFKLEIHKGGCYDLNVEKEDGACI